MKTFQIQLFYARPHPDSLPRGEGTAAVHFIFCESVSDCRPHPICQKTGSVFPSLLGVREIITTNS
jgi:hypothetical protein